MKIEIISGSAREGRRSHLVANSLHTRLQSVSNVEPGLLDVKTLNLPLLAYKFSNHPEPSQAMVELHERCEAAEAFIIVSPEYNGSYSGALKNTMDYLFPEYHGKPFGIVTVSAGGLGGISAMKALQHYCLALRGYVCPQGLTTPRVHTLYENGQLVDEAYASRMDSFIETFLDFCKSVR